MEKTLAGIEANIASLHVNVAKCRELAEQRRTHGQAMIAERLLEFVADLEARVTALETLAKGMAET